MERQIRDIVIGIAETPKEDPHLAPAIRIAEALGATLHIVHAFRLPDPVFYPYATVSAFDPEVIRQIQDGIRSLLEEQVRKSSATGRIRCHVVPGPAAVAVLDVAEEVGAGLVVVGATRRGTLARAVLGTTAQRVVRASRVPVLVNRRPGHDPLRRVLLTTDLSEPSARAYERGAELATMFGGPEEGELRALLVIGYDFAPPPPLSPGTLVEAAETQLGRFLNRVEPDAPKPRGKVRAGDPAREIVAEAEAWGADLLVIGTHGRTGASRLLIGSVAEAVVRNAPCDVLVIPNAATSAGGLPTGAGGEDS